MDSELHSKARLLLIDTCGEPASVALSEGSRVLVCEELPRQRASAGIIAAVGRLLTAAGFKLTDLQGIGIVSGPGSFTGVRTGLAVAKGLSEAVELPLIAVSRLAVLADAAGAGCRFAVLDAGRGELYVRDAMDGREFLCADRELMQSGPGQQAAIAESSLEARLLGLSTTLIPLQADVALPLVLEQMQKGAANAALLDGHYLREEGSIYKRPASDAGAA